MTDEAGRIAVADLTKVFGSVRAVDNLSFAVAPGTVTGFLGPRPTDTRYSVPMRFSHWSG